MLLINNIPAAIYNIGHCKTLLCNIVVSIKIIENIDQFTTFRSDKTS